MSRNPVTTIVVIGASGFIGEHLLTVLADVKDIDIRALVHRKQASKHRNTNVINADLLKPETLDALFSENCTVINLAYLEQGNLDAMVNLAKACARNKIRRLIHCSTAVVVGNTHSDSVTENTCCVPISAYQQTKLQMEAILLEAAAGKFEITILRPTAVFGPGGKNLLKLANELSKGNRLINYLKSCLFNRRSMNLVCVENVVAALVFLINAEKIDGEVFIVSDDDAGCNNYLDIQKQLMKQLRIQALPLPVIQFPMALLAAVLRLANKSQTHPVVKYSDQKLAGVGFKKPMSLETGIDSFSSWYRNQ